MTYLIIPPVNGSVLANASSLMPLSPCACQSSSLAHLYPGQEKFMCGVRHQQFIHHISSSLKPEDFPLARAPLVRFLEMTATPERLGGLAVVEAARYKPEGYVARLFGQESWFDWSENRTELGYAIGNMIDILNDGLPVEILVAKLDPERLAKANEEARVFLEKLNPIVVTPHKSRIAVLPETQLEKLLRVSNSDIFSFFSGFDTIERTNDEPRIAEENKVDLSGKDLLAGQSYCQAFNKVTDLARVDGRLSDYYCSSSVTPLNDTLSVVVEGRDAFLLRDNIRVQNSQFTISPDESRVIAPSIVALSSSRFATVESTPKGIFSRVFGIPGEKISLLSKAKKIADFNGAASAIRLSDDSFLIVRTAISEKHGSHSDIHAQVLKIDENNIQQLIGAPFKVNTAGHHGHHGHRPSDLSIIALSEKRILVTWKASAKEPKSPRLFYGRIFSKDKMNLLPAGDSFQLEMSSFYAKLNTPKVIPVIGAENFFVAQWGDKSVLEPVEPMDEVLHKHTAIQLFYASPTQPGAPPVKIGNQFNSNPCDGAAENFFHTIFSLKERGILSIRTSNGEMLYEYFKVMDPLETV